MPCTRIGYSHTRLDLDSSYIYSAEDLEFLDTPVHIYVRAYGDHAQTQDYNDDTHCEFTTNYGCAGCTKCYSYEIFL